MEAKNLRVNSIKGPSVASFVLSVESSPCCKAGRLFADNLYYQIPTQASAQHYIVNIHGNMSSYKISKEAEVWIVKDKMDRFHIFIADFFPFFKLLSIIFLRQEMQLVFVSNMASVLRFLLCRRNVLPSCLESQ